MTRVTTARDALGTESVVQQRLEAVAGPPLFAGLTLKAIGEVASQLTDERYHAGEVVFAEGDAGDRLLIIAEGEGELSARGSGGVVPLATVGPGDVTGELSLLGEASTRVATLTAICASGPWPRTLFCACWGSIRRSRIQLSGTRRNC